MKGADDLIANLGVPVILTPTVVTVVTEDKTPASVPVRRLLPQFPVGVADSACLAYRFAASTCSACVDACPTGALAIEAQRVELRGDCLRCGRCHAACPTGAVAVAGFAVENTEFAGADLHIACWKSPRSTTAAEGAIRVPCLFGLSAAQIVRLRSLTVPRHMLFVDHGWCAGCSAGCGETPADKFAEVAGLMRDTGLPEALQPRIKPMPLPASTMPGAIPDAAGQHTVGRRAFFSGLLRESLVPSAIAAANQKADQAAPIRTDVVGLTARNEMIVSLSRLVELFGRPGPAALPATLFARVTVNADCAHHAVCASHCPTGALVRWNDAEASGLRFDSLACIGCGQCRDVCPEGALAIEFGSGYQTVTELTRVERRYCRACGGEISGRIEDESSADLCGNCIKSRRLARSAFSELFGARA